MFYLPRYLKLIAAYLSIVLLHGCSEQRPSAVVPVPAGQAVVSLEVFKTETCECCNDWIEHIEQGGIAANVHHPENLDAVKNEYGIAPRFQSCHTAISEAGYVFEGHVPVRFIQQFMSDPPAGAIGLAVAGMPVGSPGMEIGDRFSPYDVLLLKNDGSSEVYAEVRSAREQYP